MKIIDFLKDWVIDITILFVLVSLVEIAIPNSKMKKYINAVIGLIIIVVIITPFINLIDKNYSLDNRVYKSMLGGFETEEDNNSDLLEIQEEQIRETYINKIEVDVKELVSNQSSYEVVDIYISITEDEENYGNIEEIDLVLKDQTEEEESKDNTINVIKIEEIKIDSEEQLIEEVIEFEDESIEHLIIEKYGISKDKIRIYFNSMEEGEFSGEIN